MSKISLILTVYNFKKNILWNIKTISQCNDESLEPTTTSESFFNIIGTSRTVQLKSEPTFPFQYMSNCARDITPLLGEMKICVHHVFCRKFNFEQLLHEALFDIIGTLGSVQL